MCKKLFSVFLSALLMLPYLTVSKVSASGAEEVYPMDMCGDSDSDDMSDSDNMSDFDDMSDEEGGCPSEESLVSDSEHSCEDLNPRLKPGSRPRLETKRTSEDPVAEGKKLLLKYSGLGTMSEEEIKNICSGTIRFLKCDPSLVEINDANRVIIAGDIHANLASALDICVKFLRAYKEDRSSVLLCLGDYVDRGEYALGGPQSAKVVMLLFQFKQLFPKNVFLLRGNHEDSGMNGSASDEDGFGSTLAKELKSVGQIWSAVAINEAFAYLPYAAVVDRHVFCVHGGIGPDLMLKDIRDIKRSYHDDYSSSDVDGDDWDQDIITCMLWSDPYDPSNTRRSALNAKGFALNSRGVGFVYSEQAVRTFYLNNPGIDCIVRGHQYVCSGHECKFDSVHTVFSALDYNGPLTGDKAKILIYHKLAKGLIEEEIVRHGSFKEYVPVEW